MKNVDLMENTKTAFDESLFLKCLADYNFELSGLFVNISSAKIKNLINKEFARVYEVMKELVTND
jgi:hypothetical protein